MRLCTHGGTRGLVHTSGLRWMLIRRRAHLHLLGCIAKAILVALVLALVVLEVSVAVKSTGTINQV